MTKRISNVVGLKYARCVIAFYRIHNRVVLVTYADQWYKALLPSRVYTNNQRQGPSNARLSLCHLCYIFPDNDFPFILILVGYQNRLQCVFVLTCSHQESIDKIALRSQFFRYFLLSSLNRPSLVIVYLVTLQLLQSAPAAPHVDVLEN